MYLGLGLCNPLVRDFLGFRLRGWVIDLGQVKSLELVVITANDAHSNDILSELSAFHWNDSLVRIENPTWQTSTRII